VSNGVPPIQNLIPPKIGDTKSSPVGDTKKMTVTVSKQVQPSKVPSDGKQQVSSSLALPGQSTAMPLFWVPFASMAIADLYRWDFGQKRSVETVGGKYYEDGITACAFALAAWSAFAKAKASVDVSVTDKTSERHVRFEGFVVDVFSKGQGAWARVSTAEPVEGLILDSVGKQGDCRYDIPFGLETSKLRVDDRTILIGSWLA
jgi:hypothetical protein